MVINQGIYKNIFFKERKNSVVEKWWTNSGRAVEKIMQHGGIHMFDLKKI